MKFGNFLVDTGIITENNLKDALELQKDNPQRLIGEIIVTQGVLEKEDIIMALEMYYIDTGNSPEHYDEWLDQEEVDMLLDRIENRKKEDND